MGNGCLEHIQSSNYDLSSENGPSDEGVIDTLCTRTIAELGVTDRRSMRRGGVWG